MDKKKLLLTAGAAVIGVGAIVGTTLFITRDTPEKTLYSVLTKNSSFDTVAVEENADDAAGKISSEGIIKKDGTYKFKGNATCQAKSPDGDLNLQVTATQVQESLFMRFDSIALTNSPDAAVEQQVNDYLKETIASKTILIDDADPSALGFKDHGIVFNLLGADSTKISNETIASKLKEYQVLTILSTHDVTHGDHAATEYNVLVRRSAYEKFMDALVPNFPHKDAVLDNLFENDTEEISLVIDESSNAIVSAAYAMPNICATFMGMVDETAVSDMPKQMRIKSSTKADSDVENLTKPAEYLTLEEFQALFATEE